MSGSSYFNALCATPPCWWGLFIFLLKTRHTQLITMVIFCHSCISTSTTAGPALPRKISDVPSPCSVNCEVHTFFLINTKVRQKEILCCLFIMYFLKGCIGHIDQTASTCGLRKLFERSLDNCMYLSRLKPREEDLRFHCALLPAVWWQNYWCCQFSWIYAWLFHTSCWASFVLILEMNPAFTSDTDRLIIIDSKEVGWHLHLQAGYFNSFICLKPKHWTTKCSLKTSVT